MKIRYDYIFKKNGWILRKVDLTPSKKLVMSLREECGKDNIVAEYDRAENRLTFLWKDLEAEQVMAVLEAMGVLNEV